MRSSPSSGDVISVGTFGRPASRALSAVGPCPIVLDDDLVAKVRQLGARRGLGYQMMLKLIVREHVDDY